MVNFSKSQTLTPKRGVKNKLVLGFASATAAAIIGSAGVAAAAPQATVTIPNKAACANYQMYHFKNRGQCVSAYEHALGNGRGSGYGGNGNGNHVSTSVTVDVSGNNNVVSVVINNIIGH